MSEPKKSYQVFRRDFLVGMVGGVVGGLGLTRAATAVAPPEMSGRILHDGANLSYAQQGEDLVVESLMRRLGIAKATYLDVGAYKPIECNNTYLMYLHGGHGVLVEPNIALTPKLKSVRPRDTTLTIGIGITDAAEADFYLMSDDQRHTFDREEAIRLQKEGGMEIKQVVKIPLVNINRVMAEHFQGQAPDYLSIDIEGLDYEVLKTMDYDRFRPKIICVETMIAATSQHNPKTIELLASKGYVIRGMTYPNTIFVDSKLKFG